MFTPNFRIVETDPDALFAVYDGELWCDLFESREQAEAYIDRALRHHELDERFKQWITQVTKDLGLETDEVLDALQLEISTLVHSTRHPRE